ncbi:MAG: OmpA family protein [Blastocatellia bacterium]
MAIRVSRFLTAIFIAAILIGAVGCKKPKVQLQVSRDKIQQGDDVSVSWTSKDAKSVSINGETVDKNGSKIYKPDNTTTFMAVAKRGSKEARDSRVVAVNPRPPRPGVRISLDKDAITRGQSTTLRWSSTNADRVEITDLGTVPGTGTRVVSPSQSTTYTASAMSAGGSETASTRLTVTEETTVTPSETRARTNSTSPTIAALFNQWVQPVYFDLDQSELLPDAKDKLRRAAQWLAESPNRSVVFRIEGNCDSRGTEEYNIGLGERRAQAAREFLVSLGIEIGRMQTVSYGEERASGSSEGSTQSGFAHDRRDDFIYVSGGTPPRNP